MLCSEREPIADVFQAVKNVAFLDAEYSTEEIASKFSDPGAKSAPAALEALHMIGRLCNGAKFDAATANLPVSERQVKGDATDTAVLRFSEALSVPSLGIDTPTLLGSYDKFFEIPFNSRNKWMLSLVQCTKGDTTEQWLLVKGGPDVLFPKCVSVMFADGTTVPLDTTRRAALHAAQERWSSGGERVLALCRRDARGLGAHAHMPAQDLEACALAGLADLTLVGLVGIRDPPRADVPAAVETIRRAGVRVFMVTGDFKLTALAIARQVRCRIVCAFVAVLIYLLDLGWYCHAGKGRLAQGNASLRGRTASRGTSRA